MKKANNTAAVAPGQEQDNSQVSGGEKDKGYQQILTLLQSYAGVDFSMYKESTMHRRIDRRKSLIHMDTIQDYCDYLRENEEEVRRLYEDIFIDVTGFFRDEEAFHSLYELVMPKLFEKEQKEVRIWSVACCTGEEAYSLAILVHEYITRHQLRTKVQIFATDIVDKSIAAAKAGIYEADKFDQMPSDFRERYFDRVSDGYKIKAVIRSYVVFAQHNVLADAPFSRLDLISCRNLFLYIKSPLQEQILNSFARWLKESGYLFLGSSESAGSNSKLFAPLDTKWRIFQKTAGGQAADPHWSMEPDKAVKGARVQENVLSDRMAERSRISFPASKSQPYVEEEQKEIRIRQLETALRQSNDSLQNAVDELENRNELLRETNEKMIVANEELQSSNEEIRLVNEELQNVNQAYQNKIEELLKANADLDNLLQNAEVGALYIDQAMCIRKITPIMERTTNLIAADTGRPIAHVCFMQEYPDFEADVKSVLEDAQIIEKEVRDDKHRIWLVRIRPYYDSKKQASGALVTMFDITKRLEAAKYELKILNDNLPGGITKMRFDKGLLLEYANQGFYRIVQCDKEEFITRYRNHYDYLIYPQDWAAMKKKIRKSVKSGNVCHLEYRVVTGDGGTGWRMMEAMPMERNRPILQCIITDITPLKEAQQQMDSLINNIPGGILRLFYDGNQIQVQYISDKLMKLFGYEKEQYYESGKNMKPEELLLFEREYGRAKAALDTMLFTGEEQKNEYQLERKDGAQIWVEMRGAIVSRSENGVVIQYTCIDTTKRGKAKEQAQQEKERLHAIVSLTADLVFEYDIQADTMRYYNQKKEIANQEAVVRHYTKEILEGDLFYQGDRKTLERFCTQLREGRDNINVEIRKLYGDGKYHWIAIKAKSIKNAAGVPERMVGKTIIIDDRKMREETLRKRSERDSLTGLYNAKTVKRLIMEKLAHLPEQTQNSYLMVIDVDDFKKINDSMGHLFGDAVLTTFTDELKLSFPGGIAGRIGGDEFLLFAEHMPSEEIIQKMKLLNARLQKAYKGSQKTVTISCSAGIAACEHKLNYEQTLKRADSALYYVKRSIKGEARLYDESMCIVGNTDLGAKKPITSYSREVVIRSEDDLVLFTMEMFEKVPDIKSVIRAVSDRICRYYGIQDILYLQPGEDGRMRLNYHWGRGEAVQFVSKELSTKEAEWEILLYRLDAEGMSVLRESQITTESPEHARSMLAIHLQENDAEGYMMFTDWYKDRTWEAERRGLKRLSYLIYRRLRQLEEMRREMEETDYIVNHDKKTGLLNYTSFLERAERCIREHPEDTYYLLYSDFSNFQYLNETYGYAAGDQVLKEFGKELKETCEKGILFARVTADHFVSLHTGIGMEELRREYTGICRAFCERINLRYEVCKLVLVSGICEADRTQEIFAVNIDNANLARKAVKNKTQTLCIPYTVHMRMQSQKLMEISANMEGALAKGEFVVFLQPKVEIASGRLVGAEALVRWMRADGAFMCPDEFIPVFEKNGFVTKIDFEILRQVLAIQQRALKEQQPMVRISVNFSRQHQENPHLVSQVEALLQEYGIPGRYLEMEVTESVFLYDLEPLNENIQRLKRLGVSVSIDDFGSGYSSLNVLSKVQADMIKLDRQFLLDMEAGNHERPAAFLRMLIDMIKQLGFRVIAEGVETKEQVQLLQEAGCEYAQGYYYAKPMPYEQFIHFMDSYGAENGVLTQ